MGDANSRKTEMSEYRRRGSLTRRKLMEYIPTMVVTYLSLLLINSADQAIAGNFIGPDNDEEKQKLITDNYSLIKKISKSVEYQYILNMNYTKITLE